jgi:hypothetical protein
VSVPALILPVSGPYTGLWDANPLGTQNDDGFELSCTLAGQEINASDAFGLTLVEGIYRGQNWKLRLRGLEWNKEGMLGALQMFGSFPIVAGTLTPVLTNIGERWSTFCQTLLLTAILGDPPSTPASLTAMSAGISPNFLSSFMFTSKMREFPLEFCLLPYQTTVSSVLVDVPFTTT